MLFAAAIGVASPARAAPITLAPVFSDHMVIQRNIAVPVWGWARPHDRVRIILGASAVSVTANDQGRWRAMLPPQRTGKPLTLTVESPSGRAMVSDIAVGDVYLCSGQSNMEFAVAGSTGGAAAIATAADPDLRLLSVPLTSAAQAMEHWPTAIQWQAAKPDSVASFSAACYFMGRELRRHEAVPIGLIGAAVGGSAIQAWLSGPAYRQSGGDPDRASIVALSAREPSAAQAQWGAIWQSWWQGATGATLGTPWREDFQPDRRWLPEEAGQYWDQWHTTDLPNGRGMVWYRTTVRLTEAQARQRAVLELGEVRELDQSWVNGAAVGSTYGANASRAYSIPDGTLHAGDNVIVSAIDSRWTAGGFPADSQRRLRFADGSSAMLDGWRYRAVPDWVGFMPRPPWNRLTGASVLNNGMIAPLGNFPMRAVAWYQGEQNGDDAGDYQKLLTALMMDWRSQFGAATRFLIVQLPNFGTRGPDYPNANWAWLREAQRLAVRGDSGARLIVTIDVGEAGDIHPRDKLTVGLRLAEAARSSAAQALMPVDIGEPTVDRDGVIMLKLGSDPVVAPRNGEAPMPFVACAQTRGTCREIVVSLAGNVLRFDPLRPDEDSIRYCWAENTKCNLFNVYGNPLTPFEIFIKKPNWHANQ